MSSGRGWYFLWILEASIVNSYILYKELARANGKQPLFQLGFRRQLIFALSEPVRGSLLPCPHTGLQTSPGLQCLQHSTNLHQLEKGIKRRDCVVCSSRKSRNTRHLTLYYCNTCTNKPALCPTMFPHISYTTTLSQLTTI